MLTKRFLTLEIFLLLIFTSFSWNAQFVSQVSNQQSFEFTAITGATLIDGTGHGLSKDSVVVLKGSSIAAVGRSDWVQIPEGARVIDARGLIVAPGFIDAHNHSDRGFAEDPSATTQVSQGITTVAIGQDGGSAFPIGEYLAKLDQNPVALNVLTFVGHATVRARVMGPNTQRHATADEIEKMKQLVRDAMSEGAFGLSSGLEYETGKPATTDELIALATVSAGFGGIYISHIRDEADETFVALNEAIEIGKKAHLPVQISHIKLGTAAVWGQAAKAVALINRARRSGQDVTADCYPYDAWSSTIRVLIPSGRHDDPTAVARGLADVGGARNITVVSCQAHPEYEFKTLQEISLAENISPVQLYMKVVRDGGASVVCHSIKESDIRKFYQQPWVMVSTDGGIGSRHPRGAGTNPKVLGRFVRELHWLGLEEAIRKMTSLPAQRFGLKDRGLIRSGFKADLVLFDQNTIIDRATFQQPQLLSEGVKRVFVNGVEVWIDREVTGRRPGQALRRQ